MGKPRERTLPQNVTYIVVKNDVCIGCGLCAGICPAKCLEIKFNAFGEYKPFLVGRCLPKCNVCLSVCPFCDHENSQDDIARDLFGAQEGIQYDRNVGYHLGCYVGYSSIHRERGASGGMATWMSETLLTKGLVDGVICVRPSHNVERLFEFTVAKTVDEIRRAASSRYYPVEMSQAIKYVLDNSGRYAIVGLPCFLYGLRLAQRAIPKLKRRLGILIGLTCGNLPNTLFTEFLARRVGMRPRHIASINYRVKNFSKTSSNFSFVFEDAHGLKRRPLMWSQHIDFFWSNHFFRHNACNYCDDVFAEVADAVFMDAWLPEYIQESKGTSLIVIRNPELLKLLRQGIAKKTCHLSPIGVERVVQSQGASIRYKKEEISGRIYRAEQNGQWVPRRRREPSREVYLVNRRSTERKMTIQEQSKIFWAKYGRKGQMWRFHLGMLPLTMEARLADAVGRIHYWITLPYRVLAGKTSRRFDLRTLRIVRRKT